MSDLIFPLLEAYESVALAVFLLLVIAAAVPGRHRLGRGAAASGAALDAVEQRYRTATRRATALGAAVGMAASWWSPSVGTMSSEALLLRFLAMPLLGAATGRALAQLLRFGRQPAVVASVRPRSRDQFRPRWARRSLYAAAAFTVFVAGFRQILPERDISRLEDVLGRVWWAPTRNWYLVTAGVAIAVAVLIEVVAAAVSGRSHPSTDDRVVAAHDERRTKAVTSITLLGTAALLAVAGSLAFGLPPMIGFLWLQDLVDAVGAGLLLLAALATFVALVGPQRTEKWWGSRSAACI